MLTSLFGLCSVPHWPMLIYCSNRTLTHIPFHPIGKEDNNDSPPHIQNKSAIINHWSSYVLRSTCVLVVALPSLPLLSLPICSPGCQPAHQVFTGWRRRLLIIIKGVVSAANPVSPCWLKLSA